MRRRLLTFLLLVVPGLLAGAPAQAAVPRLVNYQGVLTNAEGLPLEGAHTLLFRIYADSSQVAPILWQESHPDVLMTKGVFDVLLGGTTTLPDALFGTSIRWLGISADLQPELKPRTRLTSVPFAFRAAVADSVSGAPGVHLNASALAGPGLAVLADSLAVQPGTGIVVTSDQVRLTDSFASGAAYDSRFVNEGQTNSVAAAMITPDIVSSLNGVSNDGGNIDLVADSNIQITPNAANHTVTIAATDSGDKLIWLRTDKYTLNTSTPVLVFDCSAANPNCVRVSVIGGCYTSLKMGGGTPTGSNCEFYIGDGREHWIPVGYAAGSTASDIRASFSTVTCVDMTVNVSQWGVAP